MGVIVIVVDAVEGGAGTALRFIGHVGAVEALDEPDEIGERLFGKTGRSGFRCRLLLRRRRRAQTP